MAEPPRRWRQRPGGAGSPGQGGFNGGDGGGGNGGNGGAAGSGSGGGLFNLGAANLTGGATAFISNVAFGGGGGSGNVEGAGLGGVGGIGLLGAKGGDGGAGSSGLGGSGGSSGDGEGGGVFTAGSFVSPAAVIFTSNQAIGHPGGLGGASPPAAGGAGGTGSNTNNGGDGGFAAAGSGGGGGTGGSGFGGGLYNSNATVSITAPKKAVDFAARESRPIRQMAHRGGTGGTADLGLGGFGGFSGVQSAGGRGGDGGMEGTAGPAARPGNGERGGLLNAGTASFTGVTVNFMANQANAVGGGPGNVAVHSAKAETAAAPQGTGRDRRRCFSCRRLAEAATAATAGIGVAAPSSTCRAASLPSNPGWVRGRAPRSPRPRHHHRQPGQRSTRRPRALQRRQGRTGRLRRSGSIGLAFPAGPGGTGSSGVGIGGGLDLVIGGTAVIDNTTVTGNHATTTDDNVHGTFST